MRTSLFPRRPLRTIAMLAAGGALATSLVLAPAPAVAESVTSRTRTEPIVLRPTTTDQASAARAAGDEPPTAGATTSSARLRRQAATTPFVAVGATVDAAPSGPVRMRTRGSGTWSPWFELHFDTGDAPDPEQDTTNPRLHSAPVWVGSASTYEIDVPAGLDRVDVHLVEEVRTTELTAAAAGAAPAPAINPRSAWGARPPKSRPVTTQDLRAAVVHHSVTPNGYSQANVPGILRSIQAYHQDVNGWDDIAYNFAVDRFGRAWEARAGGIDKVVLGGHSRGFNTGTVGVVVLGDHTSTAASSAAVEAVARVIAWKFALHHVDPASTVGYTTTGSTKYAAGTTVTLPRVVGHRDVQSTGCPGGLLYARLPAIRSRVAQLVPSYQQGTPPVLLEGDHNGDGLTDPFEYRAGSSPDVLWRASTSGAMTKVPVPATGAYRAVTGDFDADGRDDIFWHGTGSARDVLWWAGTSGFSPRVTTVAGSYVPTVGDFDGDGRDDIYWYSAGLGPDYLWYFGPNRTHVLVRADQDLITGVPLVGDFDADGKDDIFWYGPGVADDWMWRSTGRAWAVTARPVTGWYDPVVLDFSGDGEDDILWYAPGATSSPRWDFAAHTSTTLRTAARTGRPHVGDFDGDGRDDVLLAAPGAPADVVWYSTPTGVVGAMVSIRGQYTVATGPMDPPAPLPTDDVLLVSLTGTDYLWPGTTNRTFLSAAVG